MNKKNLMKVVSMLCILMVVAGSLVGCADYNATAKAKKDADAFWNLWFLLMLLSSVSRTSSTSSSSSCSDSCSNSLACCTSRCCSYTIQGNLSKLSGDTSKGVSKCQSPLGDKYACTPLNRDGLKIGNTTCVGSGDLANYTCNVVAP
ncbi:MAG: hypothetical protein L6Q54_06795 [Leptospiraceae bacterium]|nr:hypothetical protein [Leptospiraceae bacterium]MCK6380945.1 hypothetical protein [Leptospiraceae bacterium]NUM42842.1 hypothetical protein [Leptospiraceae bacterium]